jgi:alpha-galactosidase
VTFALIGLLLTVSPASPPEQLALTPPMGWNSWNKFACHINEQIIRHAADAMVANGMKAAGYRYVDIDDCWQGERDAQGFIQADAKKFPSGIRALADYIHGKGLRLGIYSDAGAKTCGGHAGSRGAREARFDKTTYRVRDLWTKKSLGTTKQILNAEVASHDVLMMRLDRQ